MKSLEKYESEKRNVFTLVCFVLVISVIGFVVAGYFYWNYLHQYGISDQPDAWGMFGDYFGGTMGAIFGFMSVCILCYTIIIQVRESAEIARFNTVQSIEVNFYELIRLFNEVVRDLYVSGADVKGRECFKEYYLGVSKYVKSVKYIGFDHDKESLTVACGLFFNEEKNNLGHYFRMLYHIVKYIDKSSVLRDFEQKKYLKIVRAQLSTYEIVLLFFNGFYDVGFNFKKYIEKYDLLQGINEEGLEKIVGDVSWANLRTYYDERAYRDLEDV